jgi:hypothetical protein
VTALLWLAALPCLFWTQGANSAPALKKAAIERVCVAADQADAWRAAGLTVVPLSDTDLGLRETVAAPGIRPRPDRASATRSPWVFTNGSRFLRDPAGKFLYDLPAGKGALAAAEAYAYGADAVLKIDPADLEPVGQMLAFLASLPKNDLPDVADVAVVDDGSATMGEALNLLVRRNLLFKIVPAPSAQYRVSVKLGTPEFPADAAADPSTFALKVRRQLTDEQRTLRIFGTEIVIGRLTGDGSRMRLHLLNYGGRDTEGVRVRLRGAHPDAEAIVAGQGKVVLEDRGVVEGGTEFTLPRLGPYGVVDLPAAR